MKNKLTILTSLTGFLMMVALGAFAQQINFSGNWQFNGQKSVFDKVPAFVALQELSVTQTVDSVFLIGTSVDKDGIQKTGNAKYALNGSKIVKDVQNDVKLTGFFTKSADSNFLTKNQIYTPADKPDEPIRSVIETWTLSSDGKTLSVATIVKIAAGGGYTYTSVYDKK